jgi:protein-L-isoaspartate(D-aspartate) O-methyltransferase
MFFFNRLFFLFFAFIGIILFSGCILKTASQEAKNINFEKLRKIMVEEQIIRRGVKDGNVLNAMLKVPRHEFVPETQKKYAYEDHPLPIGSGQTISQPYIVASMTEYLRLKKGEKVLEIGTGSGYQAAVLAELTDKVYSVEIICELADRAKAALKALGYDKVVVKCADGYKGLKEFAPFDAVIVTAAPPYIPQELVNQLKTGGRMVLPVGEGYQELLLIEKTESEIRKTYLYPVLFVPMVHGE